MNHWMPRRLRGFDLGRFASVGTVSTRFRQWGFRHFHDIGVRLVIGGGR